MPDRRTPILAIGVAALVVVGTLVVLLVTHSSTTSHSSVSVGTTTTTSTSTPSSTVAASPPPGPSTTTVGGGRLSGQIVAIDPGHNGGNYLHPAEINRLVPAGGFKKECDTTGAETNAGYSEALYTFNVSMDLANDLRALGATVVLTRTTNDGVGPCVNERAAIGNDAHANVAVSIHADGGPAADRGFHVIQPGLLRGYTEAIVGPSHQFALALRAAYSTATGMPYATYIGSQGLDTRTDLGGLNLSTVPKVFIETGNMRNATDAALLVTSAFQQQAAQGIANGIVAFLTGGA